MDNYKSAIELIDNYNVIYLNNKSCIHEGIVIHGSPYSPSFHRDLWAFNADEGQEIKQQWSKIPSDVNILITHTPVYGILDSLNECAEVGEDPHAGCKDLLKVIKKRLLKLKLHCSGHIHDNYGVQLKRISNTRRVLFSNGAVLTNQYKQLITNPLIITI